MTESFGVLGEGTVFAGDYRIVRPLATGGMGAVYVVSQSSTGKERALKLMRPELAASADARRRFLQEARVGARIESEHVVEIHSAGVDEASGAPYLVMELLAGEDLASRLERGPLSMREMREVFEQVCHAMAAAHDQGIVHRDLKPENVFLATAKRAGAERMTVKVLDFGIAKLALEAGSASTGVIGTPLWMAPEQADRGKISPAADVWALSLMVYRALTGRYFWRSAEDPEATYTQVLKEVVISPIPLPCDRAAEQGVPHLITESVNQLLARSLARDPGARPQTARTFWNELAAALDGAPAPALSTAPTVAASMGPALPSVPPGSGPRSDGRNASPTSLQATQLAPQPGAPQYTPLASPPSPAPPLGPLPMVARPQPLHHDSFLSLNGVSPKILTGLTLAAVFVVLTYLRCNSGKSKTATVTVRDSYGSQVIPIGAAPTTVLTVPPIPKAAPPPRNTTCRLCTDQVTVTGPLTKEQIVGTLEAAFPKLEQECLTRHGRKSGPQAGSSTLAFAVKEGMATTRKAIATTSNDGVDGCLSGALSAVQFPVAVEPTEVEWTMSYNPR